MLARSALPRSSGAAVLSVGGCSRESALGFLCPGGVVRPIGSGGGAKNNNQMMTEAASDGKGHESLAGANSHHGKPAHARGHSGLIVGMGESHDGFACAGESHGESGVPMSLRDGLGGAARARESQDGFGCIGGSHGVPARVRECSIVAAEGGSATGDARLANEAFVGLYFVGGNAFRRTSSPWPKEPLGQSNWPLSLSFEYELVWLFRILLRLSFEYFRDDPNVKW